MGLRISPSIMGLIYCVLVSLWTLVNAGISYAFNKINHVLISRLWILFCTSHFGLSYSVRTLMTVTSNMIIGSYVLTVLFVPALLLCFEPISYVVAVKNVQYHCGV